MSALSVLLEGSGTASPNASQTWAINKSLSELDSSLEDESNPKTSLSHSLPVLIVSSFGKALQISKSAFRL